MQGDERKWFGAILLDGAGSIIMGWYPLTGESSSVDQALFNLIFFFFSFSCFFLQAFYLFYCNTLRPALMHFKQIEK